MAVVQKTKPNLEILLARIWRNCNLCALLVGVQNDVVAVKNIMDISEKIKNRIDR